MIRNGDRRSYDLERAAHMDLVVGDVQAARVAICAACGRVGLEYVDVAPGEHPYAVYGWGYRCPSCKVTEVIG